MKPQQIGEVIMLLLVWLCLPSASYAAPDLEVHIGSFSKAVDYAPYLVARDKQWIEEGLAPLHAHPQYQEFQTLPSINESFAAKRLDLAFSAEIPAMIGNGAGIPIDICALSCSLKLRVLVHKNSGIKSFADLKGKRIAVLAGTSAHYGLVSSLRQAGLSKSDAAVLDMPPPDAKSAFDSNKVDAWAVWPPFVEQEIVDGKAMTLDVTSSQIESVMVVRDAFRTEHKDVFDALRKIFQRSRKWTAEHPQEAQSIVAKQLGVPLPVIALAWPSHDWNCTLDARLKTDMQNKADFLQQQGFIKRKLNVNSVVRVEQ